MKKTAYIILLLLVVFWSTVLAQKTDSIKVKFNNYTLTRDAKGSYSG